MVADPEIIRDRANRVRRYVKDLHAFAEISQQDFARNTERQYAVLHAFQLAADAVEPRQLSTVVGMGVVCAIGHGYLTKYGAIKAKENPTA